MFFLGVFLTDLTFIEEGNPDKLGGLINFKKRLYVYNVLNEIQNYQKVFFFFSLPFSSLNQSSQLLEILTIFFFLHNFPFSFFKKIGPF